MFANICRNSVLCSTRPTASDTSRSHLEQKRQVTLPFSSHSIILVRGLAPIWRRNTRNKGDVQDRARISQEVYCSVEAFGFMNVGIVTL